MKNAIRTCLILLLNLAISFNSSAQSCLLTDEFDGSSLDSSWMHFQQQYYTFEVSNGQLSIDIDGSVCNNNCPWFHAQSAGFIYKVVVGDFDLTTVAEAVEASGTNSGDDISNDTQLGGIMARNGNSNSENYVFNVVGTRFDTPSIETKSTTNNSSGTIEHFGIPNTRSELRMTREGPIFNMYSRNIGDTVWIHRSTFNRSDFPDTLQVGVIAYAFESYPEDLLAKFEYVRFSKISTINNWLGGNGMWNNPNMWSLNKVPDSTHSVVISNPGQQSIQILQNESFKCFDLEITGDSTEIVIEGQLSLEIDEDGCN